MECVYREGESTGFVRFDHLGHTCNASKGYIRPSVWLRYGGITRDWLVESMLSQPCKFESKKIHTEFTPEIVRLHNVIQKMHMAASLLKEKFEFSFSVHCVSGHDL
uniref:Uncharacterized protein n=1 Tax=Ciona savignyi TaxID=51511 RepID=H2ZCY5_CIOSA